MSRAARPLCAFFPVIVLASSLIGETPDKPDLQRQNEEAALRQKGALAILEQVLSNAKNLRLPQNRIAVETEALQLLWGRDEARANGLLNQLVSEIAQASGERPGNSKAPDRFAWLRQQRQQLVQFLEAGDPQAALRFLATTRPYVRMDPPEQEEAEERQIQLNLASQEASRDPRAALQMAEEKLEQSEARRNPQGSRCRAYRLGAEQSFNWRPVVVSARRRGSQQGTLSYSCQARRSGNRGNTSHSI